MTTWGDTPTATRDNEPTARPASQERVWSAQHPLVQEQIGGTPMTAATRSIDNSADVIDSRDILARIAYLEYLDDEPEDERTTDSQLG